jgi:putative endonuclease
MVEPKTYWVYIVTNTKRGVMYVGITSQLMQRVSQHRDGAFEGFTKRYGCKRLVLCEGFSEPHLAIAREKRLKRWRREWKFALIEAENPEWRDLWEDLTGVPPEAIEHQLEPLMIPDKPLRGFPG